MKALITLGQVSRETMGTAVLATQDDTFGVLIGTCVIPANPPSRPDPVTKACYDVGDVSCASLGAIPDANCHL